MTNHKDIGTLYLTFAICAGLIGGTFYAARRSRLWRPEAFAGWNFVASIGAYIGLASTLFFVGVVLHTLLVGRRAAANPWGEGATTLEWRLPSPPPFHTYNEIPVVA